MLAAVALFSGWHWPQLERPSRRRRAGAAGRAGRRARHHRPGWGGGGSRSSRPSRPADRGLAGLRLPAVGSRSPGCIRCAIVSAASTTAPRAGSTPRRRLTRAGSPRPSGLVDLCFFALMAAVRLAADRRPPSRSPPWRAHSPLFAIPSTAVGHGRRRPAGGHVPAAGAARSWPSASAACRWAAARSASCRCLPWRRVVAGLVVGSAPGRRQGRLVRLAPLESAGRQRAAGQRRLRLGPGLRAVALAEADRRRCSRCSRRRPMYWKAGVLTVFDGTTAGSCLAGPRRPAPRHRRDRDPVRRRSSQASSDPDQRHRRHPGHLHGRGAGRCSPALDRPADPLHPRRRDRCRMLTTDGSVIATGDLPRGATYTREVYSPNPTPKRPG